jgi:hypothetical protein
MWPEAEIQCVFLDKLLKYGDYLELDTLEPAKNDNNSRGKRKLSALDEKPVDADPHQGSTPANNPKQALKRRKLNSIPGEPLTAEAQLETVTDRPRRY